MRAGAGTAKAVLSNEPKPLEAMVRLAVASRLELLPAIEIASTISAKIAPVAKLCKTHRGAPSRKNNFMRVVER